MLCYVTWFKRIETVNYNIFRRNLINMSFACMELPIAWNHTGRGGSKKSLLEKYIIVSCPNIMLTNVSFFEREYQRYVPYNCNFHN